MNKKELVAHLKQFYRQYGISDYDCHVSHGCALVLAGVMSETNDIDLKVPLSVWKIFDNENYSKTTLSAKGELPQSESIKVTEHIDIQLIERNYSFGNLEFERGIAYRNLNATLKDYQMMNREKDKAKIALIEKYLQQ